MRSYFNKLSITFPTHTRLVFIVLMVMVLLDRINTFFRFSIIYTDSDQTVLWQVSKDLMNGIFHGPCFYGQSYNPIIEPLFSLPFLLIGMEYSTALPLTTILMSTFPFVLLSIYLFRKVDPLVGTIPLIILLLLSLEFGMLTSISRGFVTGLFFAIPGLVLMAFHSTLLSRFIGGLLFGVGVYANPNCLLLLPLLLSFTTSFKESFWKMFIPAILGFCIGAFLIVINAWYYNLNPDLVIHDSPSLKTSLSSFLKVIGRMDNYFDFVSPIFWRAGWLVLAIFIIVGIRTWRHGYMKNSITIFTSLIIIIASFFFSKVSDGTNSVFFSGSRIYLAYPFIIIFILVFLIKTLNEAKKRLFYTSLITLSLIAFTVKIVAFNMLLNRALRGSAYSVVQVIKVKELNNICENMLSFSDNKIDLVLANSPHAQDQIITYGCQCLIDEFPTTFQPLYERRTWLFPNTLDSIYSNILIYGNRPRSWDQINIKNLNIVNSDTTKKWILINNNLETQDLLATMNIMN